MDELHAQILNLAGVKNRVGSDEPPQGQDARHLGARAEDDDRLVDQEEKIMLARVQFQDTLAELTLPDAMAMGAAGAKAVAVDAEEVTRATP